MGRLEGRVALVTGAASGIGRAIALRFAGEGARLVAADVTRQPREGGEPIESVLPDHAVRFVPTDVADQAACEAAVAAALDAFGRLDILVNNAAVFPSGRLTEISPTDWHRALSVNLTGSFLMARAAVTAMLRQEPHGPDGVRGRLVNIGSQHGMVAAPESIAYGASKAGVNYLTRQIAVDYAKDGIVCNAVAPGKILTGKTGRAVEPRWIEYSERRTPWPRLGRPEDVANAALFLASDEASFITGEILLVDGGWMAG